MTIGFVGLGHLGIVSAVVAASKGYAVIAYDMDLELIDGLRNNQLPIYEPGLEKLYLENRMRIGWTQNPSWLKDCNLIFITIDTPTDKSNKSNYNPIFENIKSIIWHINEDTPIIISSQVYPGFTRSISQILPHPAFYQPEFLVVGNAIKLSCNPTQIVVGTNDEADFFNYTSYYDYLETFNCPKLWVSYESAEMAKISTNIYLANQVATTNNLAEICVHVGADWRQIQPIVDSDKRIGSYTKPGLGLSGGHLERDIETIIRIAKSANLVATKINDSHYKSWVNDILYKELTDIVSPTVAIWGLTYKPGTSSIKNSPGINTLNYLNNPLFVNIKTYDPYNIVTWQPCNSCTSPESASHNADILCIMTADQQYSKLSLDNIRQHMKGNIIIDPYGILNHEECIEFGFKHFQLGVPNE